MVKVVSWNIGKREKPWRELVQMASDGAADVALLQEAGSPPGDVVDRIEYVDGVFWNRHLYDRWPLVVKLSDRITVEPYRQVPPTSDLGEEALGVSGIGTIAAARVTPRDNADASFVAVSMYARWLKPHPSTKSRWRVGYADASAHRILSDLSAFIGHADPTKQRILAAGDLNMFYGATGSRLSLPTRDRTVWDRMPGARAGVPGSAGAARAVRDIGARRRAAGHEERADVLPAGDRAENRGQLIGLRVRVARVPREGVRAGNERH